MYLIITRSYPPEIGGMQNLMWGLTNELSKHYMIKVFANYQNNHKNFEPSRPAPINPLTHVYHGVAG